ncbi:hypothetical protein [Macrococcus animalis]|uniref:hypothetical protein n=1 Tax=Macrococcus animalis TaxID=3395467 RepID=UPI0039BEB658
MTDLKYDYNSNRASDICRIIRKMDYRFIPAELINILNDIALNHTNPQDNKINITKKDDDNMKSYEMLISNALNCSRSEAIRTIGEIIYENKSLFIDFRETILKVSEDKNPAVRLACLFALWPSYNIDQKWAEKIILKLYIDDYRLLGFEDSNKMLFNLYQNNKKEVIKLIKKCFKSDDKDLIRIGGHCLCIMNVLYNEFTDIIENICDLNENQKRSILEMSILYFKFPQYNNNSKKIILKIVQNSNGMHISLSSLFSKKNINLERDKDFLIELIKIIPNNRIMYSFIRYLENESLTLIDYEEIIFSMAYSLLESPNEENKIWRVENEISQLVIGLYDETCNSNIDKLKSISEKCLDLWDLMFENQIGNIRMLSEKIMER